MLVSINGVDLTPYINQKKYSMNAEDEYTSWKNGNYKEIRKYSTPKVKGSFELTLYGKDGMTLEHFLEVWNGAVVNRVATLGVYVENTASFEAIAAYYEFKGTFHRKLINGDYLDRITVDIKEM